MFIRKMLTVIAVMAVMMMPALGFAETQVVEGAEAQTMYEESKSKFYTLRQVDKTFILVAPDGTETPKPDEVTVAPGEFIFITNEEEKIVHNVYDQSDHSWVLKKQQPGGYAAIAFGKAGVHKLRCAIHPKMKITVNVE